MKFDEFYPESSNKQAASIDSQDWGIGCLLMPRPRDCATTSVAIVARSLAIFVLFTKRFMTDMISQIAVKSLKERAGVAHDDPAQVIGRLLRDT